MIPYFHPSGFLTPADVHLTPSRGDRRALRLLNAMLAVGFLTRATNGARFYGDLPTSAEWLHAAAAAGASSDHNVVMRAQHGLQRQRQIVVIRSMEGRRFAESFYGASEHLAEAFHPSEDRKPFAPLHFGQREIDALADQLENFYATDDNAIKALTVSEPRRYGMRLVRAIAMMAGGTTAAIAHNYVPKVLPRTNIIVGATAIRLAAETLYEHLREEPKATAPMLRFWYQSACVLRALGASVAADLDVAMAS